MVSKRKGKKVRDLYTQGRKKVALRESSKCAPVPSCNEPFASVSSPRLSSHDPERKEGRRGERKSGSPFMDKRPQSKHFTSRFQ